MGTNSILILSLYSAGFAAITTHEFLDEEACGKAKRKFEDAFKEIQGIKASAICVKKDS